MSFGVALLVDAPVVTFYLNTRVALGEAVAGRTDALAPTAGIGHTLPPDTAAVAVRADPPNAAAAGDLVQVWRVDDDTVERVATAELRGVHEDTVTLSLDEYDARRLAGGDYRLLTLPHELGADR